MKLTFIIAFMIPVIASAQQSSRLVARASYTYNHSNSTYKIRDSVTYYFRDDTKGGDPNTLKPHKYDSAISLKPDGTGTMEYLGKQTQMINGNTIVGEIYKRNATQTAWKYSYRDSTVYNTDGNKLYNLNQRWVNNAWEPYRRTTSTYNTNGDVLSSLTLEYKPTLAKWDSLTKIHNVYSGKRIDTALTYDVLGTGWQQPMLEVGTHQNANNSNYLLLLKTSTGWDSISRYYSTYDNNGNLVADSVVVKDQSSGSWTTDGVTYYTYNSNGDVTEMLRVVLDIPSGNMVNYTKVVTTYNSYYQPTEVEYLRWDATNSQWIPSYGGAKEYYYYQGYTTDIAGTPATKGIKLYPNPAGSYIIAEGVSHAPYRIMNLSGQTIRTGIANDMIHINDLATGQYFIDFGQGNMQRFIKQ